MSEAHQKSALTDKFQYEEIIISENKYLIGVCNKNDVRQILVTNLVEFYEENLCKDDLVKRCEDLNPALIDFNFEEAVDNLLVNITKYVQNTSTVDILQLEDKVEDGRFKFNINLTKCNSEHFQNDFFSRLYFSFGELLRRYNCLSDIVKKKDQEIAEYKAQGVQLLRQSLVTEPFSEDLFHTKCKNTEAVDKINVFLDAMKFYNSIKTIHLDKECVKQESVIVRSESNSSREQPQTNFNTKRPASSNVRCAVPPKLEKKTKLSKQNPELKFL